MHFNNANITYKLWVDHTKKRMKDIIKDRYEDDAVELDSAVI